MKIPRNLYITKDIIKVIKKRLGERLFSAKPNVIQLRHALIKLAVVGCVNITRKGNFYISSISMNNVDNVLPKSLCWEVYAHEFGLN